MITLSGIQNEIHSCIYLDASDGDKLALRILKQERSLILDSFGRRNIFDQTDNLSADILQSLRQTSNHSPRGPRP